MTQFKTTPCKCCKHQTDDGDLSSGLCPSCDEAEFYKNGGRCEDMSEMVSYSYHNDFGG